MQGMAWSCSFSLVLQQWETASRVALPLICPWPRPPTPHTAPSKENFLSLTFSPGRESLTVDFQTP